MRTMEAMKIRQFRQYKQTCLDNTVEHHRIEPIIDHVQTGSLSMLK